MDLKEIQTILQANTHDSTLTLPPNALLSPPIEEIFRDYLLNADLVIRQVSIVPVGGQNVTVVGQGGSFPFENTYVTAVFTVKDNVAAMAVEADGFFNQTNVWKFEKAFPVLANTFYKDLKFTAAVLTLRSSNASVSQPKGLSFAGKQELSGTLAVVSKLLNGSTDVQLRGPILLDGEKTAAKVVPVMALEDPSPGNAFGMAFIFQLIDKATVIDKRPPDVGTRVAPVPLMQLVSRITVDADAGRKTLDIIAHFTPAVGLLTFQANMDQALTVSQSALNALARGANLGSVLPPQLPLVNSFRLGQWSMSVIPEVPQITSISMGARIAEPWTVIPRLFTLETIDFTFTINYVNDKFEPNAALTATVKILDGPAQFTIVVDARYPSYVISGYLEEESKVDLIALVRWILGDTIAGSLPCKDLKVTVLSLLIDPRNSTFTFETVIQSHCSINLGIATFTLTEVHFNFNYVAGKATGSFAAAFWIVPPQPGTDLETLYVDEPPPGTIAMEVSAAYNGAEDGWSFRGGLASDGKIDLDTIVKLYLPEPYWGFVPSVVINQLEAGFETGASKAYDFTIGAEWNISSLNTKIGALVKISSELEEGTRKDEGEIQGFLRFGGDPEEEEGGLELKVTAKFNDTKKEYIFEFLGWTATLSSTAEEKTLTFEAGNKSLGEMIEVLVNAVVPGAGIQLAPPWSVLNSIPLRSFKFVVHFSPQDSSPQSAGLTYSPNINIGFAKLDHIALDYDVKTKKVMFKITKGEFLGQKIGAEPVQWDVADPETTKKVPGEGSQVFKLTFLGMGQHMAVAKGGALEPVPASISQAITQLSDAFTGKQERTLIFNEATDWLIGTKFTVLQAVDFGIVFYDPELYGLVISVNGPKAADKLKVFEGLIFEILYKKINDTIGMWQIDLTLPKYIRNLQFGAVSVTLPSMKVQIYTNGDFMIDLGFPANDDFSRSFSLQALPFVGSGGLYFGVLSSATSDRVPKTTNGSFSPVIAFGLGLRIGLGKDLDYGVVKAGISITIQGVLEGIFAWYNPYPKSLPASFADEQMVPAGTRELVGRRAMTRSGQLTASASGDDFYYMIQARVALVGKLYGSVDLGIISATLDVEVRVSIRLTLEAYRAVDIFFEARISLSLKVRINLGLFKITINLSFKMTLSFGFTIGKDDPAPWDKSTLLRHSAFVRRLDAGDDEDCGVVPPMKWQPILNPNPVQVPLRFVPQFTAGTDGPLGAGSPRKPYVVAMTYVSSMPPKASPGAPAPFDEVARGALLWTLNAYLNREKENTTLEDLLAQDISIEQLNQIYCCLTQKDKLEPFTEEAVLGFLEKFYLFQVTIPPVVSKASAVVGEDEDVSIFPIMPLLKLTTNTGIDVDFFTKTPATDEYLLEVKKYFEELAVRYKTASEQAKPKLMRTAPELANKSLASFIFMDFFAMLARSTVQDAINLLQTQQAPLETNESLADFVTRRSDLGIDVAALAIANASRPLRAGVRLRVPGVVYTVKRGDTVESVAAKLNHNVEALHVANPLLKSQLPKPASQLRLPAVTFKTSSAEPETLLDITRAYGVSITELAEANQDVAELFPAGEPLLAPYAQQQNVGKLVEALQANGSFNNLSGLAVRVLLQGLRPPSPKESPQAGTPAPLYELTGQQFDGSDLVVDSTITLSVPDEQISRWFHLGANGDSLSYTVTPETAEALTALKNAAFAPTVTFQPAKLLRVEPRRFTLATSRLWHTPVPVITANRGGDPPADTIEPHLWQFPSELMQVITGAEALQPKIELWTQRQEGPGQTYPREPVTNYTWSTVIEIQVRQTASGDGVFLPNTYEVTGVDGGSTKLLENLLVWYGDAEIPLIDKIRILYPPDPAVENQTAPPTGLTSDSDPTFFLLQTNLSTASQPPQLASVASLRLAAAALHHNPLGQADIEFLKLLWESSVVNSGGYVLYYEAQPKLGLPNYLFSQDGIAKLTLLVTYSITNNVLRNFLNNVVIHQVIDTEHEVLYASAVPQTVSDYQLLPNESLADVAARFRVTISQLATQHNNAHAILASGKHLRIPPLTYRVRPGDALETIAARANLTTKAVIDSNPTANANDLSAGRFIRLPETVWRVDAGDSLASLAERFSTSVVTLAHANKNVPGLIQGTLQFDDRLEQAIATIPPGNVAFQITRKTAIPVSPDVDAQKQLAELYNLLGYRIKNKNGFTATNSALPISPITPEGTSDWIYESVVPVFPFATSATDTSDGTPDPQQNPYNGVGSTVCLNFNWQDLFGNWIDSGVDQNWPDHGFLIGYIDNLIPLDQWPAVTSDYIIARNEQSNAELSITLRFRANLYLPSAESDPAAIKDMALTDLGKFRLIYYQLQQPDVSVTVSSTMQVALPAAEVASAKDVMVQFVLAIINFLTPIAAGLPAPPAPVDTAMSQAVADQNPDNLFALNVKLEIARNPDLVSEEFKDIPAVTCVSSRIPANAGNNKQVMLQAEPAPPLSLQEFARRLETAFPALKVLVAAPQKSLGQAEEIWIARFAPTDTGIAFKIDGLKPSFFAVTPLSRNLLSRPDVLVYPYVPGKYIGDEKGIIVSRNSIDIDQMGRDFLAAMEQVLGPQFSAATWKLEYDSDNPPGPVSDPPNPRTTPYEAIMAAKELLATAISNHVANVFTTNNPNEGLADARESLRQQLLIDLTSAYTVDVIMQYPVAVTNSQFAADDPFAPRLFGKPVTENPDNPNEVSTKDAYSFSTGKFSLAKRATHLTFSFDTNREQQGKAGEQIDDVFTIDLFHQINALEHDIHPVRNIEGYLASSWLTFVLPDSFDTPGEKKILVPLGKQTIPVPLRAYPTPPSLSEQTFIPHVKQFVGDGDLRMTDAKDELLKTRLWNYRCQYEYVGAAHDKILASVKLNVPPDKTLKARFTDETDPDLFAALVQFTAVYAAIARDLDQYLATGTNNQIAFNAISSFAWLAQRTAKAWQAWQNTRALYTASPAASPEYYFVISQRPETVLGVIALVVTVTADGPGLRLAQLPRIEIEGYTSRVITETAESVTTYFVKAQDQQELLAQDPQVLTYDVGRNISSRQLVFSNFDILQIENGWAGAAVKRNENLLPDHVTNPDFVFQSPVVRFVNVLTPLLDPDVEIDIVSFTPNPPALLSKYLSNFLTAFFEGAETGGNENRTIRLSASYSYALHDSGKSTATTEGTTAAQGADLKITTPILLTTPTSISILKGNLSPESAFISAVADTIETWFRNNKPSGVQESGRLWFDLSIYSSLSESQLPVLRMRRLFLETRLLVFKP